MFPEGMVDFALPEKEKPIKTLSHLFFALVSRKFMIKSILVIIVICIIVDLKYIYFIFLLFKIFFYFFFLDLICIYVIERLILSKNNVYINKLKKIEYMSF